MGIGCRFNNRSGQPRASYCVFLRVVKRSGGSSDQTPWVGVDRGSTNVIGRATRGVETGIRGHERRVATPVPLE